MPFDPQQFLHTEMAKPHSTEYVPIPEGEWPGICTKVDTRTNTKRDTGEVFHSLQTFWELDSPEVRKALDQDHPTVRYDFLLEFDDNGMLAEGPGKNVKLGRLREAIGKNNDPKFKPIDIKGCMAMIRVGHRIGDDGTVYSEGKAIAPMTKVA